MKTNNSDPIQIIQDLCHTIDTKPIDAATEYILQTLASNPIDVSQFPKDLNKNEYEQLIEQNQKVEAFLLNRRKYIQEVLGHIKKQQKASKIYSGFK